MLHSAKTSDKCKINKVDQLSSVQNENKQVRKPNCLLHFSVAKSENIITYFSNKQAIFFVSDIQNLSHNVYLDRKSVV